MSRNATANTAADAAVKKVQGRFGESHPSARLTADEVREARKLYKPYSREFGVRALARRFGVSYTPMQAAISGNAWQHVPM